MSETAPTHRGIRPVGSPPPPEPLFILAPPCTFSWGICAMLGEHPDMYGLPELHLFSASTVAEWWALCSGASFEMDHGLVRAVAEIVFGEQTEVSAGHARGWLRRRGHFTTGLLFEAILDRLSPRIAVEKSPSIVQSPDALRRALEMFPSARFLHLVSHPRLFCEVVMGSLREAEMKGPLPPSHWLLQFASGPIADAQGAVLDPQASWFLANRTIITFLSRVPEPQRKVARGEHLVAGEAKSLREVAEWLGVRTDPDALEAMRHPERSPHARLGPPSARFGTDAFLREGPLLDPAWTQPRTLEGPLDWRTDGGGFMPRVSQLAREFGYA
jgi:hypothetical protein